MTREELRAALVERALSHWYPNGEWEEESRLDEIWARGAREEAGAVIDALGVLDAAEALERARRTLASAIQAQVQMADFDPAEHVTIKAIDAALRRIREGQP